MDAMPCFIPHPMAIGKGPTIILYTQEVPEKPVPKSYKMKFTFPTSPNLLQWWYFASTDSFPNQLPHHSRSILCQIKLIEYGLVVETHRDVIYNAHYPLAAPDIIFAAEDESFHPFFVAGDGETPKSSLCDWNIMDPSKLLALIHELRDIYVLYQRKRIAELDDKILKFEISTIHSREELKSPEEVRFTVPLLDMDINKLVHGCPWKHQQIIYLQVVFPIRRRYAPAPSAPRMKLVSSSELKALFSVKV
ncbi:hypothetical protein MKW98_000336 [Papaver atlanticum]|uniref:BRISC and BRCA1-A complex member 2 n=1 Tax=Papaver atlanticum TaxID=357466 RepID=A0AAD4X785_9MAGN|nr:hypothetical protein MKW98_000336 [Papaver atlanticum]